jgi:broad specificity phosphatase PhoE
VLVISLVLMASSACDNDRSSRASASAVVVPADDGVPLTTGQDVTPPQLCVVRHAEAYRNLNPPPPDLTAEQLDTLTPNGEDQARRLASVLPEPVGLLWSSPTKRTRQTAELSGLDKSVALVPELRLLEGDVSWDERVRHWQSDKDPRPDGGESLADGHARVLTLLERLRAELPEAHHAVVVTHGDIASLIIGELQGTSLLARPTTHTLGSGETLCLPLPATGTASGN